MHVGQEQRASGGAGHHLQHAPSWFDSSHSDHTKRTVRQGCPFVYAPSGEAAGSYKGIRQGERETGLPHLPATAPCCINLSRRGLCVLRVAVADLELVRVLEHIQHRDRLLTGELPEVVGVDRHLALADRLGKGHHSVRGEGRLRPLKEHAVGGARNAHRVEHLIVLLIGQLLIGDVVAGRPVAVLDEPADRHQLGAVDVQHRPAVLAAAVQRIGERLGAVLARDIRHQPVALAVLEHAVQMHKGEVVRHHRLGILRVAHEDVVEPLLLDIVFGIDMVLFLDAGVGLVVGVDKRGVDDLLDVGRLCRVDRVAVRRLTLGPDERHRDQRKPLGTPERFDKPVRMVEVRHPRLDPHVRIRLQRRGVIPAEDEVLLVLELEQHPCRLGAEVAVYACQ